MFKFGFELEGVYLPHGQVEVPPKEYPTDGFPGLVELRTSGYKTLREAYGDILVQYSDCTDVTFTEYEAFFDSKQRAELRCREERKSAWDIQNLYGKAPRLLGNRTIASCQINVSNLLSEQRTDDKGVYHSPRWGLLDVPRIVRALDEEFADEIKEARRQPGEYCIKDVRLEYRSLPNFAFELDLTKAKEFLNRIDNCIQGEK
jgi:hypothetical protein